MHEQASTERPSKESTTEQPTEGMNTNDNIASGPKKEFNKDPNDRSGEPLRKQDEARNSNNSSGSGADGNGPQSGSNGEGTGQKWVKSTGMSADGGNFDATMPGAGKEANRKFLHYYNNGPIDEVADNPRLGLLEEKGIHRGRDNRGPPAESMKEDGGPEKTSVGTKLKEKLHIGYKEE